MARETKKNKAGEFIFKETKIEKQGLVIWVKTKHESIVFV